MGELKDDISVLELKISQLRVQYDQYFTKQIKLEPLRLKDEVEKIILFHTNKPVNSFTLKFRFSSAVAKYSSYKHYWTRTVRSMEDGKYTGGRSETGAFSGTLLNKISAETAPSPANRTGNRASGGVAAAPPPAPPPTPAAAAANNGLQDVFKNYIETKRKCNEPVEGISYDAFAKTIQQSTQKAKEAYKTDNIDIKVTIKDGKAKITLVPKVKQD
ncbi:MAG: hypothetical protein HZB82_02270 [Deltaproteobacteria bacterium]|nr:hypothetical protein [Deltaproteobacteria bacterium]